MPIFISFNAAIRKIKNGDELMMSEGPILMTNLTLPVETWILPIFIGSMYWLSMQVNLSQVINVSAVSLGTRITKMKPVKYFLNGVILLMVYISGQVESGITLFWAGSATIALMSNLILLSPRVLRMLKIPKFQDDPKEPYKMYFDYLAKKFKLK